MLSFNSDKREILRVSVNAIIRDSVYCKMHHKFCNCNFRFYQVQLILISVYLIPIEVIETLKNIYIWRYDDYAFRAYWIVIYIHILNSDVFNEEFCVWIFVNKIWRNKKKIYQKRTKKREEENPVHTVL